MLVEFQVPWIFPKQVMATLRYPLIKHGWKITNQYWWVMIIGYGYIINNPPLWYYNGYIPPNRYGYKPPNRLYNGYIPPSSYGFYG